MRTFFLVVSFVAIGEWGASAQRTEADALASIPTPNLAQPDVHPYADPKMGRAGYLFANEEVNEFRLYDFYSRQADYYLATQQVPEIIPAYPGMEAGIFGHWGKYSQFHLSNDRWSRMDFGRVLGGVIRPKGQVVTKAVVVSLGNGDLSTCFDPLRLTYTALWSGKFVKLGTSRWGMMSNLGVGGEIELLAAPQKGWVGGPLGRSENRQDYLGYYRYEDEIVFRYRIGETEILDWPSSTKTGGALVFTRTLKLTDEMSLGQLRLFSVPDGFQPDTDVNAAHSDRLVFRREIQRISFGFKVSEGRAALRLDQSSDGVPTLLIDEASQGSVIKVYMSTRASDASGFAKLIREDRVVDPETRTKGGPSRWNDEFTLPGRTSSGPGPYVVDQLPVPVNNPYQSMMFLSGLAFFPDGVAAVATFFGDIWLVSGIDASLKSVHWKRIATGLNQPLGLEVVDGKLYVLGKDQITILHDLNGDHEADYFENFCHTFETSAGGHDYNTGLQRDREGNFYFATKHAGIYQISPDGRKASVLATGLRNPNGIGVSPSGRVVTSPQQGQWAPASMIIEANEGEFYGYPKDRVDQPIAPPLCYIPRGIDNSTGGQLFVTSDRWGPYRGQLLSFSFGDCSHYLVLRDADGGRAQGAVVPLPGEFESGAHRGRFNPLDGQLYVVGSQGWGNYAFRDGSLQRVRYTGKEAHYPVGLKVHANGIRVDFPSALASVPIDARRDVFCQQWNYQYSKGYGSPEFSLRYPDRLGHDHLPVRSVHVLDDRKSLFIEIPRLEPAMQVHVRLHVKFEDGEPFATDLYATILRLGTPFLRVPDLATVDPAKSGQLELRILEIPPDAQEEGGEDTPGRPIEIKAVAGLKYDQTFIKVRAGERLSLTLENADVMPHNWVLVGFEGYTRVGRASERMLNDPLAFQKQFVPESRDVIVHTPVVNPNERKTIHFNAPSAAGEYPFLCTYPGHWQLMRGTLIVY